MELNGDLIRISSGFAGNDHNTVAIIAAHRAIAGVRVPLAVRHELILIHAGLQRHGDLPNTVRTLGHLIGAGAPVVHGACQIHGGSAGILIAEGDGRAVDLRAEYHAAFRSGNGTVILLILIGGGGRLDPDLMAGAESRIAQRHIHSLTAVKIVEQQSQTLAGYRLVFQRQNIVALLVLLDSLTGPLNAVQSVGGAAVDDPRIAHHHVPTGGIDKMDVDIVIFSIAADAAHAIGVAVACGSDGLGVFVAAGAAGIGAHTGGAAGGRGGDFAAIAMVAHIGGIAQGQGVIAVDRQGEGNLHAAGNKQLVRVCQADGGAVQGNARFLAVALGHIPLGIVAGLDENKAV